MEKKDWRERLQHDIGFLYKFDGNESWTDVHDKVLDFIEQEKQKSREATLKEILGFVFSRWLDKELDKAREEGTKEGYRCPYCMFVVSTAGQLRHHIQVRHLSKLKDNK